jgi:glycosyltransferase involved in cell wall biosynthesis
MPQSLSDVVRRVPVVLAILPRLIPSTLIGVVKPLLALHREGRILFDVVLESRVSRGRLARADVVVFCRNTEPRYGAPLVAALELGKAVIYELDDNFFAMPPGIPGAQYHRDPERLGQLERYLKNASVVRVYSEALRARVVPLNPCVYRVDGAIDWDLVPMAPPPRRPSTLRVVYATSRIEDTLAPIFAADLRRILDTFHGRVEAWFLGYRPPDLAGRPDVHFVEFVQDYDTYFRRFASAGFDIGLAPLPDEEFYRAKSDNKFREYAASRIAGIYSDVQTYRECVVNGRTGLLVPAVPDAWFNAMVRLIEDEALRTRMQDEAWRYARTRYGMAQSKEVWLTHLEAALERQPLTARPVGATPEPLGVKSRATGFIRRGVQVFRGEATLATKIRWHFRTALALAKLQRTLARTRRNQ